jgi:APA family basic amino acid/polyamine antiporter
MTSSASGVRRVLSLFDTTCIIVGIIIGATIYESAPRIAANVGGPAGLIGVWILGGAIALIGALCYAELSTAYPRDGGDYVYLSKAYGRPVGFLFAWTELWIIRPANTGAMAFVFAKYFGVLLPESIPWREKPAAHASMAGAAVLLLTIVNLLGVKSGKWTQNALTVVKVAGLAAIAAVGFALPLFTDAAPAASLEASPAEASPADASPSQASFVLAIILVMFAYGGWKDMSAVAAEVRDPDRNIFRGLVLGASAVMLIYVTVNLAFLAGLGYRGLATSNAAPADLIDRAAPAWGGRSIAVLICFSTLGAINGMLFTGSRIYYALGTEHWLYRWLGTWSRRLNSPVRSLLLQGAVTILLIALFGAEANGFERLVVFSSPFFFFFLLLVGVGLFVLRWRDRDRKPSAYRVIGYPVTPLLFCASTLFMLYSSAKYAYSQRSHTLIGALAILAAGGLLVVVEKIVGSRFRK